MIEPPLFDLPESIPAAPRDGATASRTAGDPRYGTGRRPGGVSEHRCRWCGQVKRPGEFARSDAGWVTQECRSCAEERLECWARVELQPVVRGRRYIDPNATELICTRCGRSRPKDLFYVAGQGRSGQKLYRPRCKQCTHAGTSSYRRAYNQTDARRRQERHRRLWRTYGISIEEYEFLAECQDHRCAICGTTDPGGPTPDSAFHVDHDHKTQRVRGLLCRACNTALGLLKESPEVFITALAYLQGTGNFAPLTEDEEFDLMKHLSAEQRAASPVPACIDHEPKDT